MAEIGLGLSIFEIISLGFKLSKALYDFAETVRGAETSFKHVATEVEVTSMVLKQLGSILEEFKKHGLASDGAIMTVDNLVRACWEGFNQINATLEKAKAASEKSWLKKPFILAQWPRLQKEMENQRSDLEKLKSNLSLGLGTLGLDLACRLQ